MHKNRKKNKTKKVCESKKVGSILRTETASMEGSDVNPRGEMRSKLSYSSQDAAGIADSRAAHLPEHWQHLHRDLRRDGDP